MFVINARNVNDALPTGLRVLHANGRTVAPRGIVTREATCPVSTVYECPWEMVLHCPIRNANPFFHLFEALWILAGRRDVLTLSRFNTAMNRFSEDGVNFHAAYGYRLRAHFGRSPDEMDPPIDQITEVVRLLSADPDTRRAVLTIWDPSLDLNKESNDIPCNSMVFLKLRDNRLNLTVLCRSNDIIWGCYGTNCVQFAMIQQRIAMELGCGLGTLTQVSDSFHAYIERPDWEPLFNAHVLEHVSRGSAQLPYIGQPQPLFGSHNLFEQDNKALIRIISQRFTHPDPTAFTDPFIRNVALPMLYMWEYHERWRASGKPVDRAWTQDCIGSAMALTNNPENDWLRAGAAWIERHQS